MYFGFLLLILLFHIHGGIIDLLIKQVNACASAADTHALIHHHAYRGDAAVGPAVKIGALYKDGV